MSESDLQWAAQFATNDDDIPAVPARTSSNPHKIRKRNAALAGIRREFEKISGETVEGMIMDGTGGFAGVFDLQTAAYYAQMDDETQPDDSFLHVPVKQHSALDDENEIDLDDNISDTDSDDSSSVSSSTSEDSTDSSSSSSEEDNTNSADVNADISDDEGDVPATPVLLTKNETPFTQLPIPTLPSLVLPSSSGFCPAGRIVVISSADRWDDPLALLLNEGNVKGNRNRNRRRKNDGIDGSTPSAEKIPQPNDVVTRTLIIQAPQGTGMEALAEGTLLVLPINPILSPPSDSGTSLESAGGDREGLFDLRPLPPFPEGPALALGVIEDVFGPVQAPLYLARIRVLSHSNPELISRELSKTLSLIGESLEAQKEKSTNALSSLAADYADSDEDLEASNVPSGIGEEIPAAETFQTLVQLSELKNGTPVYYSNTQVNTVITAALRLQHPPSDASNLWDEEPQEGDAVDFSDDEAEALASRKRKEEKRSSAKTSARPNSHSSTSRRNVTAHNSQNRSFLGVTPSSSAPPPFYSPAAGLSSVPGPFPMMAGQQIPPFPAIPFPPQGMMQAASQSYGGHPPDFNSQLQYHLQMQMYLQWQIQQQQEAQHQQGGSNKQ